MKQLYLAIKNFKDGVFGFLIYQDEPDYMKKIEKYSSKHFAKHKLQAVASVVDIEMYVLYINMYKLSSNTSTSDILRISYYMNLLTMDLVHDDDNGNTSRKVKNVPHYFN